MRLNSVIALGTLLLLASAIAPAADSKPDFSGTWKLNTAKSEGAPGSLVVKIDHKDPVFKYTASGSQDGNEFEETAELPTDGKEVTTSNGLLVKAHWDGNVLVMEYKSQDGNFAGVARHSISEDGKTLTRDADVKSSEGNHKEHLVLEKQ